MKVGGILLMVVILSAGCTGVGSMVVQKGDDVSVNYVGTLENGTMFDTSVEEKAKEGGVFNPQRGYEPLEFTVGAGQMIKGFDRGVVGMKVGETKTVTIPAAEAYGEVNPQLITEVSTQNLLNAMKSSGKTTIDVGDIFFLSGNQAKVVTTNENTTRLDLNHPLAGKTLIFDITLVEIKK